MKLHASGEDYLEAILVLQRKLGMVSSVDVARHMELSKPKNPEFDLFKEFGVIEEEVQYIRVWLRQISVQNKEISVQIKATVENDSQMYKLKLHTLWSPMKKDV